MLKVAGVIVDKASHVVVYAEESASVGQWVIDINTKTIDLLVEGDQILDSQKPIIAVEASPMIELPTPSERFINIVHKSEDSPEPITSVLVEYYNDASVKVKPDNTITVKKISECFNKDQMTSIVLRFASKFVPNSDTEEVKANIANWLLENHV
jgi:hypothetical protein